MTCVYALNWRPMKPPFDTSKLVFGQLYTLRMASLMGLGVWHGDLGMVSVGAPNYEDCHIVLDLLDEVTPVLSNVKAPTETKGNTQPVDDIAKASLNETLPDAMVKLLNEALELDRHAVYTMVCNGVGVNEALANHPTIEVVEFEGTKGKYVRLLGILNALLPGPRKIAACLNNELQYTPASLVKFAVVTPKETVVYEVEE